MEKFVCIGKFRDGVLGWFFFLYTRHAKALLECSKIAVRTEDVLKMLFIS